MRKTSTGLFALATVGGYFLYKNREAVLSFFKGLNIPGLQGNVADTTKKFLHTVDQPEKQIRRAI